MKQVSLFETVDSEIGKFLHHFMLMCDKPEYNDMLRLGLVEVVDLLSDYYEEGSHLFPSILLFDDPDYLKCVIPNIHHIFYQGEIEQKQFKLAVKMCAPLAVNGWNIFIQVKGFEMSWGVVTTEITETSLSLSGRILREKEDFCKVALISNIGMKTVAIVSSGGENSCIVHMSLMNNATVTSHDIDNFCDCTLSNSSFKSEEFTAYFIKIINTALQTGHGNLFAVMNDKDDLRIPDILKEGVCLLPNPIDFVELFSSIEQETNVDVRIELNTKLKLMAGLAVSMMNHDGITVFTDTGKVIGYHYIVDNNVSANDVIIGGARTKAFHALAQSELVKAVFMKKQEGETSFVVK